MLTRCLGVVRLLAYDVFGRCSRVALEFSMVVLMCLFTMAFVAVFMPVIRLCSMGSVMAVFRLFATVSLPAFFYARPPPGIR